MLPFGIYYRTLLISCVGNRKCGMFCLILAPLLSFLILLYFCAGIMWVIFFLLLSAIAFLIFYIYGLMEQSRRSNLISSMTNNIVIDTGLGSCDIATLPTFKYERDNNNGDSDSGDSDSNRWAQCAICLSILKTEEIVKRIPDCRHFFHIECIDKWLSLHSTCPMCRSPVRSPPLRPPV